MRWLLNCNYRFTVTIALNLILYLRFVNIFTEGIARIVSMCGSNVKPIKVGRNKYIQTRKLVYFLDFTIKTFY
jgi:predicted permease